MNAAILSACWRSATLDRFSIILGAPHSHMQEELNATNNILFTQLIIALLNARFQPPLVIYAGVRKRWVHVTALYKVQNSASLLVGVSYGVRT